MTKEIVDSIRTININLYILFLLILLILGSILLGFLLILFNQEGLL
jgi:hypothetical protein